MNGHYVAPAVDPEDTPTEGDIATLLLHCTGELLVKERDPSLSPALDQAAVRKTRFFDSLNLLLCSRFPQKRLYFLILRQMISSYDI